MVALGNGLGRAHCRWLLQGRDRGVPDGSFAGQRSERLERREEYEGRVEDLAALLVETDFAEVETSGGDRVGRVGLVVEKEKGLAEVRL